MFGRPLVDVRRWAIRSQWCLKSNLKSSQCVQPFPVRMNMIMFFVGTSQIFFIEKMHLQMLHAFFHLFRSLFYPCSILFFTGGELWCDLCPVTRTFHVTPSLRRLRRRACTVKRALQLLWTAHSAPWVGVAAWTLCQRLREHLGANQEICLWDRGTSVLDEVPYRGADVDCNIHISETLKHAAVHFIDRDQENMVKWRMFMAGKSICNG